MLARVSVLALCAVAAIATGAAANPAALSAEVCVGRLADALKGTPVPQPISALIAAVEAKFPYQGEQDWDDLEEEARSKYYAQYPNNSCREFLLKNEEVFTNVLADGCLKHLDESAEALKMSRAHPTLAPIMKANSACLAFEPTDDEQGLEI